MRRGNPGLEVRRCEERFLRRGNPGFDFKIVGFTGIAGESRHLLRALFAVASAAWQSNPEKQCKFNRLPRLAKQARLAMTAFPGNS